MPQSLWENKNLRMYSPQDPLSAVDVQAIMRDIRGAVRAENRDRDDAARTAARAIPRHVAAVLARLKASTAALEEAAARIGEVPPAPDTLRARVGAAGVRVMQRALFWLVPSIKSTQQNLVQALRDHLTVTEETLKALHKTNVQVELLRREIRGCDGGDDGTAGRE
jgi:hypothetical protein